MPLTPINPGQPPPGTIEARTAQRLAALERRLKTLEGLLSGGSSQQPAPVVGSLPTAGRLGRQVILASDGKLYRDNGASWVAIG